MVRWRIESRASACVHGQARALFEYVVMLVLVRSRRLPPRSLVGFGEVTWTDHGRMALADSIGVWRSAPGFFQRDPQQPSERGERRVRSVISDGMP